ncbi:hypothetical protein SAMN05519103_09030 [Rhizobiales bacterium GAS113]|nr:hypothetical protein SAMN05519103_09030 [Rhizobiales bacterium GAS113]
MRIGQNLPKSLLPVAALAVVLVVGAVIVVHSIRPVPPAPSSPVQAVGQDEAAKAASRAMTFTQPSEPRK